ncbi:hypothetical protein D0867_14868 [Hortaea werneckii]|uniref:HotDog ACOT-type domain-containing protein n=1 Tax=Hortaea werneckii TaxID=91943 RepID=A0A3M6Z1V5_HORWE|nr:hypothetical protein D0867_14868 [Hortaea werneckii]RMY09059.1 hypothetical protein D0866_14674 [Hortaea werneckii]
MSLRSSTIRWLSRTKPAGIQATHFRHCRGFSLSATRRTDGVFRELTDQRVQVPWIEAFHKRQKEGQDASQPSGKPETPPDRDLTPKKMSESYHSVVLPLAQEPWLLDTYLNSSGHIRLGTIFMDLDALSGVIAYKHTGDSVTTVTAAFDRITINHPLHEIVDLELSGQVTYASGRSSMEISLQVAKAPKTGEEVRPEDVLLTCSCTMVSLDPGTKKPVNIAPVRTDTDAEKQVYAQGEKNSKHRKDLAQRSLLKTAPNDEESDLIHALWQQQLKYHDPNDAIRKPDHVFFMDKTKLSTATAIPEQASLHASPILSLKEIPIIALAFCCAASFAHVRPTFVSLDPSTFQNPVPVGSVLYLTATVVYTDPPLVAGQTGGIAPEETRDDNSQTRVQIRVDSKVRDVEHGETKPTGQFNYTFTVDKNVKVLPRTYTELMMYVDARRRARRVIETVKQGEADDGSQDRVTE